MGFGMKVENTKKYTKLPKWNFKKNSKKIRRKKCKVAKFLIWIWRSIGVALKILLVSWRRWESLLLYRKSLLNTQKKTKNLSHALDDACRRIEREGAGRGGGEGGGLSYISCESAGTFPASTSSYFDVFHYFLRFECVFVFIKQDFRYKKNLIPSSPRCMEHLYTHPNNSS